MKKFFTLLAAFMTLMAWPLTASADEVTNTFDFENNPNNWTVGEGTTFADGSVNDPITVGEATLTSVQGDAAYPAIIMKDAKGTISLNVYKKGAIKFCAAEGRAVTKVIATMKSKTFALTPSTGSIADNTWTGNATEVTFTADALYSFLKIEVVTDAKNGETVEPATETFDVEATDIAAFNAAEDGKVVKLTLNNARVNGKFNDYYVEDASGATVVKGITLTPGTVLNGYVIGTKSTDNTIDYMNDPAVAVEYQLTATDASTFEATATTLTGTTLSITDACTQANYGRLITIQDVTITGGGQNKTLTDADGNTMKARDYMGVLPTDFTWPEKAAKITGIVVYYMTGWFLMPISAEAIEEAGQQPSSATFDFADANLHTIGTAIGDVDGWIINETLSVDGVSLQITGGSAPSRIYTTNNGAALVMYKEYSTLTFKAPEGKAITKIEFTNVNAATQFGFEASSGAFTDFVWDGNADGVRMLDLKSPNISKIVVTLSDKNAETASLPAINYTEVNGLAAFSALEDGAYAKLTLTDAEVIGRSADGSTTVWIQDATGGCWIQYTTLNALFAENTKVSGTIYTVKRKASGNPQVKETEDTPNSELTATALSELTMVEGTLEEVNVAANLNRVVKLTGVTVEFTKDNEGVLTQGEKTIDVKNGSETANQQLHKIENAAKGTKYENATVIGILVCNSNTDATKTQILPISITEESGDGIESITTGLTPALSKGEGVYDLQGRRVNGLQKGLNIVNGKKVVVK